MYEPTLTQLRTQYDRLQVAIDQTPPEHRAGLHHASGMLAAEMMAHPDYCPKCRGKGIRTGVNQETGRVEPVQCECVQWAGRVPCVCCDKPATHALADWDVCEEHFNQLSAPDDAAEF